MSQIKVDIPALVGGGYGKFWKFKGRYRVCKGSRASKKSKTTALNLMMRLEQYPEANLAVFRKVYDTLRDSCWADLKWAAERLKIGDRWDFTVSPLAATNKYTGQKILFRGLDKAEKAASMTVAKGYLCWAWLEEAYEIDDEEEFDKIDDAIRGELPDGYFHQLTLTFNPWSESTWLKRKFFDIQDDEILAMTTNYMCNEWLAEGDLLRFEKMKITNPARYRVAGLGEWGIDGEAVFEEWVNDEANYITRVNTHVIEPFEIPKDWRIYRGFDFGYAKPFSVGWYAVDHDGVLYRILELYGCTEKPNTGVKWSPDQIFQKIHEVEQDHRWLKGKQIFGIADPSIWDASRGTAIVEMAAREKVFFEKGDNHRISGWMQCHYRLRFDENGIPMFYCFKTCKEFIRTIPQLKYDEHKVEDIDTDLEDHIADEWRYVCMARPIAPPEPEAEKPKPYDPLSDDDTKYGEYDWYRRF